MAAPPPAGGAPSGGAKDAPARPIGPDGKPIPGPAEVRQIQAARKMAQQQAQVDEVIGIMHKNVENVLERDRKLGDLEERADALQDGCAQFEKQAAAMKNKFWMENLKMIIASGVMGVIVLGLIYWKFFMPDEHAQYNQYGGPPPGYGQPPPPAPAAPAAAPAEPASDAGGTDDAGGDSGA
eukprot:GFUD01015775.1.p1 GENE.GFUD01015775.1~~GFUD01015775.1.p1  ORF type:complete len:181 (-),score=63.95 GFUD01015775.1:488-1030(-)